MPDIFTRNDLIGLAHLFRLSATGKEVIPGNVQVLIATKDCLALADLLDAERERPVGIETS